MNLKRSLPSSRSSPGQSRAVLGEALDGLVPAKTLETAQLLTSELVTNSARHAGTPEGLIDLAIHHSADSLRVEVTDQGRGFETGRGRPDLGGGSGWGLWLVEELATRWGLLRDPTRVWFELDLSPIV